MDKVVHFEIPAEDVERAKKFYKDAFGWHIISMPEMHYNVIHTGATDDQTGMMKDRGFINGGMMKRQPQVAHPVVTISVKSIGEAGKKIKSLGGTMLKEKMAVGDMGYAAYFTDSEGNVLGLWENVAK